ncbi:uncharacterized protein [Nicotiana tomentosiformis]|uniref:uncharacterized protein n=1 Tax=Nicotiana tomentosiformis TaxID=4098 RepID=UPI00388C4D7C
MDPLKYIFQKPMPTGKLAKWKILLSEFDIVYVIQKAVKGQALADHLAKDPVDREYKPLKTYFPDEEVSFVGEDITEAYDGAVGNWRFRSVGALGFRRMGYKEHQNIAIFALCTRADQKPAYCAHVEEESDGNPWIHNIKEYLAKGEYPEHSTHNQKRMLQGLANHFFQSRGILYRRTPDLGLLRCVDAKEASRLLEEIHAGTCGPHMNGFVLAKKILRAGYFWMTMETDCIKYVQKCHQF